MPVEGGQWKQRQKRGERATSGIYGRWAFVYHAFACVCEYVCVRIGFVCWRGAGALEPSLPIEGCPALHGHVDHGLGGALLHRQVAKRLDLSQLLLEHIRCVGGLEGGQRGLLERRRRAMAGCTKGHYGGGGDECVAREESSGRRRPPPICLCGQAASPSRQCRQARNGTADKAGTTGRAARTRGDLVSSRIQIL